MENQSNYEYEYEETEVDIREIFNVILKKLWIIILATVVAAILAFALSKFYITPQYESTTKIYLIAKNDDSNKITTSDLQLGSQLTNDYISLVKSRPVLEEVISDLNLDISLNEFSDLISVTNPEDTRIIDITVKYRNPEVAKLIADNLRNVSADYITDIMDLEKVNVVEEGNIPENPVSPNILQNTLIGGILGAIISILIILIIYFLDDTIKTPDDVEKYLGLSVLGSIPAQEDEVSLNKKRKGFKFSSSKNKRKSDNRRLENL